MLIANGVIIKIKVCLKSAFSRIRRTSNGVNKKLIIIFFLLFFLFLSNSFVFAITCTSDTGCPKGQVCVNEKCVRSLEVVYPSFPGVPAPVNVGTPLPEYVKYIFILGVGIIGFLIFGVMIYNGINYLTSVGDTSKMADAKQGIVSAFLAGLFYLLPILYLTPSILNWSFWNNHRLKP